MAGLPAPVPVQAKETILCIPDLQEAGSKKLDASIKEFYNSGSTDQITIAENNSAYNKYRVRPRVLVDVAKADTSTTCLGRKITFPLCISPAGLQGAAHPDGELGTSRACAKKGVNMGISSFSNHSAKDVRSAGLAIDSGMAHAQQLYTMQDRKLQLEIIQEAEKQGCKAILLTADSPVLGVRYNEWRNDFRAPSHLNFPIIGWKKEDVANRTHDDGFMGFNDSAHSWAREIPWLRSVTKMEIWIKGVLTAEDTLKAVEMGCDGVLVSNHGGRQLDGVPATIDALPECVEAAAGRIPVHIDGGVRSGTDIFKALALGADCVWVGRPMLWGLAVSAVSMDHLLAYRKGSGQILEFMLTLSQHDGQKGVELMLDILHTEFKRCMQLAGCNTVKDITRASLGVVRKDGPLARL